MESQLKIDLKLTVEEIRKLITNKKIEFPTYAASIINLANRFAQATRPKIVGQMSELIKECPHKDFEGWKKWYMAKYPNAIDNATKKIIEMLNKFNDAINKLDVEVVKNWVEDLVLVKTYIGLMVQEPILKYFAQLLNQECRISNPEEESKGIDGFIGNYKISIKPITYKEKKGIARESVSGDIIIFYKKDKENNILITEIESLSEKGNEFIDKLRKLLTS